MIYESYEINVDELAHADHKYIDKFMGKNGKWRYIYDDASSWANGKISAFRQRRQQKALARDRQAEMNRLYKSTNAVQNTGSAYETLQKKKAQAEKSYKRTQTITNAKNAVGNFAKAAKKTADRATKKALDVAGYKKTSTGIKKKNAADKFIDGVTGSASKIYKNAIKSNKKYKRKVAFDNSDLGKTVNKIKSTAGSYLSDFQKAQKKKAKAKKKAQINKNMKAFNERQQKAKARSNRANNWMYGK